MEILQKGTHTPLHICKYGLPSFILFSHKINKSYKCILMLRATHRHLASRDKKTELVMMVCLPSCNIGRPIYIWLIGRKLWRFCKKIPTPLSTFANKAFPRSSFFSHKIKYSYKCILMLRATHGHYGGSAENIILRQAHGSGLWAAGPPCMFGGHCVLPQRFSYCKRSVRRWF